MNEPTVIREEPQSHGPTLVYSRDWRREPPTPDWWLDLKAGLTIGAGASAVMAVAVFLAVLTLKAEGALP